MHTPSELMTRIIHFISQEYKNELVLKGGMLLRLLNSPRATIDIDYVWVRKKRRTLFAHELKEFFTRKMELRVIDMAVNSRGIFLTLQDQKGDLAKIEISAVKALNRPPEPLSTAFLARPFAHRVHIVATMNLAEAYSHKIAAALERNLARDLYDLVQFESMTALDERTLHYRLKSLEIARNKKAPVTIPEAILLLKKKMDRLNSQKISEELESLLPPEHVVGLDKVIRATINRLMLKLSTLDKPSKKK